MSAKEFLGKLEKVLGDLEGNKVVDIGNLPLDSANFLKNSYKGSYIVVGPSEDKNNPGQYAISFYLKNKCCGGCKNA